MSLVTIAAYSLPNWQRDADVQLRVYPLQSFISSGDAAMLVGHPFTEDQSANDNLYIPAACTLAAGVLSIASLQLEATVDSETPTARYAAAFFTLEGEFICFFGEFASFAVPPLPNTTTWVGIALYNEQGVL